MTFLLELHYEIEADSFHEARELASKVDHASKYRDIRKSYEALGVVDESRFALPPEQE